MESFKQSFRHVGTVFFSFGLSLILSSAAAQVGGYPDPYPTLVAGAQFCSELSDDAQITRCVGIESAANYIAVNALSICREQTWDKDKTNCLQILINRVVTDAEVQVCSEETFESDKARCLQNINRSYPYRTYVKVSAQPGLDMATRMCSDMFMRSDRSACLQITSSAKYFSSPAVGLCEKQFTDKNKVDCLGLIKDRAIFLEEVDACAKVFTDDKQVRCLSQVQRAFRVR